MAADYRHIGGRENRLGRHYSRFRRFGPRRSLPLNDLPGENRGTAGRIGEVTLVMSAAGATANAKMATHTFPVLAGAGAHDVYPAPDGAVWFTAQSAGKLGRLDPITPWGPHPAPTRSDPTCRS